MTTAEYLFETSETVLPCELAYGTLRVAEAPVVGHQRVVGRLYLSLEPFVRERRLGEVLLAPTDVILDYDAALVVQPDLTFVSTERAGLVTTCIAGAPDVVIEVLSPHPRIGRLEERVAWFAKAGVRECWLISLPDRRVVVLTLGPGGVRDRRLYGAGDRVESAALPEFTIPTSLFDASA